MKGNFVLDMHFARSLGSFSLSIPWEMNIITSFVFARVAQSVEHLHGKQVVTSSTLVAGSIHYPITLT